MYNFCLTNINIKLNHLHFEDKFKIYLFSYISLVIYNIKPSAYDNISTFNI